MNKSHTLEVQEKDGEFFIELNDEILEGTGWKIGDDLIWEDNKDGSWTLSKSDKVWVLVECIQSYRMRYMVQAPATNPEYALDDVSMQDVKEFSQLALPEQIVSHRVISHDDALKLCDEDNDYTNDWTEEQKVRSFFTKEGEGRGF